MELKVKIKSLAEEARIIRREEQKAKQAKDTTKLNSLHDHRIHVVRKASRNSHLAYGFLRSVPYKVMEQKTHSEPNWRIIEKEALRFDKDPASFEERWKAWRQA